MKFNWWVKAFLLATLWLLLAWLIQRERDKKDQQIVGELMFMFPGCEGVSLWDFNWNQRQFDSLIKVNRIAGVIMDLKPQALQRQLFPDSNFLKLYQAALTAEIPVYCFNPETLKVNYGWKMLNPDVFYASQYDYHQFIADSSLRSYWSSKTPARSCLMDSADALSGMSFIRNLRDGKHDSLYHIELLKSVEFRKKLNEVVFKKPHQRWLVAVHQPVHGFTYMFFRKTPRYQVLGQ